MKKVTSIGLLMILLSLTGCEVIGDIFKAGIWTGFAIVAGIILLIVFIISKIGGNK